MRSLFLVLVLAPALACSSPSGATSLDGSAGTDASDLCRGASDPSSVMIPAENCAPACTPSDYPTGGGTESTCYDGCNWCECTCAGVGVCTARACVDASMPDAAVDSSTPDAGTDASTSDSGTTDASFRLDGGAPGESCSASAPCARGLICEGGPACGDTWACAASAIACTEPVALCGCEGSSFMASRVCPPQPIAHLGSCEDGANCNRSAVSCRRVEPVCPDGQVPEVEGSCWTDRCIPIDECACSTPAECPMSAIYTCHGTSGRCGPYL